MTIDPVTSKLLCAGHIFNLVCTAILFGIDDNGLEDAQYDFSQQNHQQQGDSTLGTEAVTSFESILTHGSEEQQHRAWQLKGPVGKLHNLVTHIKANNSRIAVFESKQKEVIVEGNETPHQKISRLVANGGIRWNSTYLMIDRALHLRDALMLYQSHEEGDIHENDLLDRDDWEELVHLKDLLAPVYEVSMQVQRLARQLEHFTTPSRRWNISSTISRLAGASLVVSTSWHRLTLAD